jgi:peptidoglycan/LPS O-acetylase OafA/YrhL
MNNSNKNIDIINEDRDFLDLLRGISITRVVLVHLGLSWFYSPYTEFVHAFMPLLFFVSGAVSYNSYLRSKTISAYLYKRIMSIYIPYLLIVVFSLAFSFVLSRKMPSFGMKQVLDFLTFNLAEIPKFMPYPLGQVWFLHSLVVIIFITAPFFYFKDKINFIFIILIVISLLFSTFELFFKYGKFVYVLGHNLYQSFSNLGFFVFGALYYSNKDYIDTLVLPRLILLTCLAFILLLFYVNDINMYHHIYSPDLYYVSLSYFLIFLIIYFKDTILKIISNINILNAFLLFMSKNAYSVFLLHSLVLWFVHNKIGISSVKHSPVLAMLKIFLVLFFTCIISIPFTRMTDFVKGKIIRKTA